jgi:glycosyltransferase involved in cell wall biosynthesis
MKISIVVPAFNEEKLLARSLTAMKQAASAFDARNWPWELIVCDNNSSDRTAEIAREAGATVVFEPVNQISRARNKGGFAAAGDWLIFIDADSFPRRALFERAIALIEDPKCAGGGCLVKLDEQRLLAEMLVAGWNLISRVMKWAAGSFIVCDARLFRQIGGFSEELFVSEELEFCQRLKKAARAEGRRLKIISEERLVTSARKIHLYGHREHLRFMVKALFFPKRVLFSREQCTPWYDGRR